MIGYGMMTKTENVHCVRKREAEECNEVKGDVAGVECRARS